MGQPRKGQTLVAGNRRWGAGDTLAEAKRNWKAQGGRLSDGYEVVVFDADTEFHGVDDMGRFIYVGSDPTRYKVEGRRKR